MGRGFVAAVLASDLFMSLGVVPPARAAVLACGISDGEVGDLDPAPGLLGVSCQQGQGAFTGSFTEKRSRKPRWIVVRGTFTGRGAVTLGTAYEGDGWKGERTLSSPLLGNFKGAGGGRQRIGDADRRGDDLLRQQRRGRHRGRGGADEQPRRAGGTFRRLGDPHGRSGLGRAIGRGGTDRLAYPGLCSGPARRGPGRRRWRRAVRLQGCGAASPDRGCS